MLDLADRPIVLNSAPHGLEITIHGAKRHFRRYPKTDQKVEMLIFGFVLQLFGKIVFRRLKYDTLKHFLQILSAYLALESPTS